LKTGCDYLAVELGENFTAAMRERFGAYENFEIVNADFETYDFGRDRFDLVYSAATIQWIDEDIAFPKAYEILKPGGVLAMFMTQKDYKSPNEDLFNEIQEVYTKYFQPVTRYDREFDYTHATDYGFVNFERREYPGTRVYSAEDYISRIGIYADHLTLPEPNKSKFFDGIREAIERHGGTITLADIVVLYLARKPKTTKE